MRLNLASLQRIAVREGFMLVYVADMNHNGWVVPGVPVALQTSGAPTHHVAHFRILSAGPTFIRHDDGRVYEGVQEHIDVEFVEGYRPSLYPRNEWPFLLNGALAHADDDPNTPWARFGRSEWSKDGTVRTPTSPYWDRRAREEIEAAARVKARVEQPSPSYYIGSLERSGPARRPRKAAHSRARAPSPAVIPAAERLCRALSDRHGSVLEGRVRVIESTRFKSYYTTLAEAAVAAGVTESLLSEALYRGDIEVLSGEGGYGGRRGLGGDRSAQIIEYIVHDSLSERRDPRETMANNARKRRTRRARR